MCTLDWLPFIINVLKIHVSHMYFDACKTRRSIHIVFSFYHSFRYCIFLSSYVLCHLFLNVEDEHKTQFFPMMSANSKKGMQLIRYILYFLELLIRILGRMNHLILFDTATCKKLRSLPNLNYRVLRWLYQSSVEICYYLYLSNELPSYTHPPT